MGGHALVIFEGGAVGALGTVGVELEGVEGGGLGVGVGGFLSGQLLEAGPAEVEEDGFDVFVDDGAGVTVIIQPGVGGIIFEGDLLAGGVFDFEDGARAFGEVVLTIGGDAVDDSGLPAREGFGIVGDGVVDPRIELVVAPFGGKVQYNQGATSAEFRTGVGQLTRLLGW
jgi:hypothetical protein